MILVKQINTEQTYFLRKEILRKNIDLPHEFDGDFDSTTFHLGAFYDDNLVGVATFVEKSVDFLKGKQYQLRGMATATEVRGLGCGKTIIQEAISILLAQNIDYLWCNARKEAVGFYQKLGFEIYGSPFNLPLIGIHFIMYRPLK